VLRFEDIDQPRVVEGAMARQLEEMKALGLEADDVQVQTERRARHWELFLKAIRDGQVYPCFCSRKDVREALAGLASAPHAAPAVYSGHCRDLRERPARPPKGVGWRFRTADASGDFLVAHTDRAEPDEASFVPAYAWSCSIDDADGGYSLLVRAWDLESSAEPQRQVQRWMGAGLPAIFHTALVTRDDGHRLEKRTQGITLPELAKRGLGPEELVRRFEASFTLRPDELRPGRLWGEDRRTLTLSMLLES
jgi:glutamyl-tRNA synthetase